MARVLVFTRSGDRVLMGRSRFRSLRPTEMIRRLPTEVPMGIDLTMLAEELVPVLMFGHEEYTVNAIDFRVFTKAVVKGDLDAPALADQLTPFYEQAKALAGYDPNAIQSVIQSRPHA